MFKIGLTGGIATGKSTVGRFFAFEGAALFDADMAVHNLLKKKDVINSIREFAPAAVKDHTICRKTLGRIVFADNILLERLESILHPKVREAELKYLRKMQRFGKKISVFDIPLLFESRNVRDFDMTITTSCPLRLQKIRALSRDGMTKDKLDSIMAKQIPTKQKEQLADRIIFTNLNKAHTMRQVKNIAFEIIQDFE